MRGTDCTNGKALSGIDHLRQSIRDILATPVGSRVMRRDYGSRLFELVDAPSNRETLLNIYYATAEALMRWEPRLQLERVFATAAEPGSVTLTVQGVYLPEGSPVVLDGLVV